MGGWGGEDKGEDMPATSKLADNYVDFPQGLVTSCLMYLWKSSIQHFVSSSEERQKLFFITPTCQCACRCSCKPR